MSMSRRKFLGTSAAAVLTAGSSTRSPVFGANDRIGACVIGFNGQGGSHIREILEEDGVEIVALCDVDSQVLQKGIRLGYQRKNTMPLC